jgi:hypothetical protein
MFAWHAQRSQRSCFLITHASQPGADRMHELDGLIEKENPCTD